jgi:two-component system NtrC family sensor kinase
MNDRMDLETRFALCIFVLLAVSCGIYLTINAHSPSLMLPVVMSIGVAVLAWAIAHYVLFKPFRQLVVMAKAVGSGDFSKRLGFERKDEIGSLAFEMDTMCDQLQAALAASEAHIIALDQLRHSDRVATLGRLASSVAHELGNPLNVIELRAQLIATGAVGTLAQAQQSADVITEQTRRMTRIISEILSFARVQPAKISRLDLVAVVRKAIALSEHTSKKHKASISFDVPKTVIEIDGDADKLLQIMVNLMVNGMQSMPAGGTLNVSLRDEQRSPIDDPEAEPRDYVYVDVVDHGVGIAADVIDKVFEPFFSTKGADSGTGLGLSVAQGIAHEHAGWITVESELGRGSSFKVHLPRCEAKGNGHAG